MNDREKQILRIGLMTAQDDLEMLDWLVNASNFGGGFLQHISQAGLIADASNYPLMRPLLNALRLKYNEFDIPYQEFMRQRFSNEAKQP